MAKKSHDNDEYLFTDLDTVEHEPLTEEEEATEKKAEASKSGSFNVVRKAIVVLVVLALLMLGYKFFGSFVEKTPESTPLTHLTPPTSSIPIDTDTRSLVDKAVVVQSIQTPAKPIQPVLEPKKTVVLSQSKPLEPELSASSKQKLAAMELTQDSMRTELGNLNSQVAGMNRNINELNNKIQQLGEMVKTLTEKLEREKMAVIQARPAEKPRFKLPQAKRIRTMPMNVYYLQALIPGRAWLISTNGSTLSVREGSMIQGYGKVRLIDVNKGRLLTSSGRVIRFSQQDS